MATGPQTPAHVGATVVPRARRATLESHPEAEAGRRAPRLTVRGGCALPGCPGQRSSSVRDPTLAWWGCLCPASGPPRGHTWPSPTGAGDSRGPLFSLLILEVARGGGSVDAMEGRRRSESRPWRAGRACQLAAEQGRAGPRPSQRQGQLEIPHRRGGGWGRRGRPRPSITGPGPGVCLLRVRPLPLPPGAGPTGGEGATAGKHQSPRGRGGPAR